MKKVSLLLLLPFLVFAFQAVGQQKQLPEVDMLIAMKDGSVIFPEVIKPRALPFQKPYLRIDNRYRLPPEEIKLYKDGSTTYFWAEVTETGEGELLRPAATGRLNTFYINTVPATPAAENAKDQLTSPQYFQLRNGPIRRITYDNLHNALTDNMLSMQKLQEADKLHRTNRICLIAGGSMVLAGIAHSIKLNRDNKPPLIETGINTRISPLLLLGAITVSVPLFNRVPAEKKLHEAIALYNQ